MSTPPAKPPRTLTLEALLPATPEQLSRMLTDPAELARWFAPFVDGSGRVGDLLTLGWGPDVVWRTRLEAIEPGRLVRWRDAPPEDQKNGPPGGMVIEWTLTAEPGAGQDGARPDGPLAQHLEPRPRTPGRGQGGPPGGGGRGVRSRAGLSDGPCPGEASGPLIGSSSRTPRRPRGPCVQHF